jgi:hypothetical protein
MFSQHGPRTVFHENESIEYKFYSTYYCSMRENEAKEARKNARESDSMGEEEKEEITQHTNKPEFWSFTGSDPIVVAMRPSEIKSVYKCVTTHRKAISV